MTEPTPITITPKRRSNFAMAPFELKVLALFMILLTAGAFYVDFWARDIGNTYLPFGGFGPSISVYGCTMAFSLRTIFGSQDLRKQLNSRMGIIVMLTMGLSFGIYDANRLYIQKPYIAFTAQIQHYHTLLNIDIPAFWIAVLSIRLVPMTMKYFKLKREGLLTADEVLKP